MKTPSVRRHSGFTLVELLVVIAIIVVLAAAGFGAGMMALNKAKVVTSKASASAISSAVNSFYSEYNALPDKSGKYAALYRPTHMIGLELGLSVASVALRKEATGAAYCFNSDVVATAKRPLKRGEILDGEGGFCVWGKQTPAAVSLRDGLLPLGLAHNVKLKADIAEGQELRWSDVEINTTDAAYRFRRELAREFGAAQIG